MQRTASVAVQKWQAVADYLNSTYHLPDLDALEIVCCSIAAHDQRQSKPIWPIIIGPPSTGKTEICITPFSFLPKYRAVGDLTPKSFLPGVGNKVAGSFLHDSGPSCIWLCKDLGTLLSKREHDAKEVFSILRDVYDGEVARRAGGVKIPIWTGKITFIAASTPFLDRAYDFINELGDRFVFVRWHRGDGLGQGRKVFRHVKYETGIIQRTRDLLQDFMAHGLTSCPPDLPTFLEEKLLYLAEATARLRTRVIRNPSREIVEVPEAEGPGRILKNMIMLTTFRAALFGKDAADAEDLKLAKRISADSVQANRMRFIAAMRIGADTEWDEIRRSSSLPASTIDWIANELIALEIIDRHDGGCVSFSFTKEFEEIWSIATLPAIL